jgi:hypothetical protein
MGLIILLSLIIILLITFIITDNKITPDINNNCNFLLAGLDGYWVSNYRFNKESEIDKMTLYIDYNLHMAYLVIIIDNKIIANDQYMLYIDEDNINRVKNLLNFNISFINHNKKKNTVWNNKKFMCIVDSLNGHCQLYYNNILYGDFIKDCTISNYINSIN